MVETYLPTYHADAKTNKKTQQLSRNWAQVPLPPREQLQTVSCCHLSATCLPSRPPPLHALVKSSKCP